MKQRILVIGSDGYIGGTVCAEAEKQHIDVQRLPSTQFLFWGDESRWPNWGGMSLDAVIIAADFERRVAPYRVIKDVEPDKGVDELCERFRRLLRLVKSRQRVLFLSTDAVFDGREGPYTEDRSIRPLTPNAQAKAAMEDVARRFFDVHIVRMSLVYGDGATKKDRRREEILSQFHSGQEVHAAVNVFRSPESVQRVAMSLIHLATFATEIPQVIHLAAPRCSLYEATKKYLIPTETNDALLRQENARVAEDTSLETNYPFLWRKKDK